MPAEPEPGRSGGRLFPRRRRRWSDEDKLAIVRESFASGVSVVSVARRYGIAPNLLFTWRRLYGEAARREPSGGDAPATMSSYRDLERQVRDLEWLLGKKTLENEMLRQELKLAEAVLGHRPSLKD
ncbi:MAG: transposase [Alphaproteobacteria bacterium]